MVLDGPNLFVNKNTTDGFVDGSGPGKTTTVDIILGFLSPTQGDLLIDDKVVNNDRMRPWQNNVGYAPQHIYLMDDSIAADTAFAIRLDYTICLISGKVRCHNDLQ